MPNNPPRMLAPHLYHLMATDTDSQRMTQVVVQLSATTVPLLNKAIETHELLTLSRLGEWGEIIGFHYGRYPDESLRRSVRERYGIEM